MGKFKQKYEHNKPRAWGSFAYLIFSIATLRVAFRYGVESKEGMLPRGLDWLSTPSGSIKFWAILWAVASIVGVYSAIQTFVKGEQNVLFNSILFFIALHIIWAGSYATGWVFFGGSEEWFNALTHTGYLGLLIGYAVGALAALRGKKPFTYNKD